MTRRFTRAAVLAGLVAIPVSIAFAQGGPPWGWRQAPPYGYFAGAQVDRAKVDAAVKQTLDKATKGQTWTNPGGVKLTPILVEKEIVGQLWEDADPKSLAVGSYWAGRWGVNAQLVKDGKIIGMLWVKVS